MKIIKIYAFAISATMFLTSTPAFAGFFDDIKASVSGAVDNLNQMAAQSRAREYEAVEDKKMVESFYSRGSDDQKGDVIPELKKSFPNLKMVKLTPVSITFAYDIYSADNMQSMSAQMSTYTYATQDDALGKKYIEVAQARGSVVKNYRPQLSKSINRIFDQHFIFTTVPHTAEWIDKDNVLIEYSPNGSIVSFMTRAHQASTGFGVISKQYTNIYIGKANAQILENKISNNEFENNFLRVVTPLAVASSKSTTQPEEPAVQQPEPAAIITTESSAIPAPSGTAILLRPGKPDIVVATQGDKMVPIMPMEPTRANPEKRVQMLMQLGELKRSGVLTDQEFAIEKQRILSK